MSAGSIGTRAPRQAAKKASDKFEAQLGPSPVKADEKITPVKAAKRTRSRPNLKKEQVVPSSGRRTRGLSKSTPPRARSRKRPVSLDSRSRSDDAESDLTSLSSPRASPSPKSRTAPSRQPPYAELEADSCVWVLLDFKGEVFRLEDEDDEDERIWWPGQILPYKNSACRVRLFGTIRTPNVITFDAHKGRNIMSLAVDDEIRFTKPKYVQSVKHDGASPKKRQKLDRADLEAKWNAALSDVVEYCKEEMPSTVFLNSVRDVAPRPQEEVIPKNKTSHSSKTVDPDWVPPTEDETLIIPGEQIIARENKSAKYHWPAQILAYIPPPNPSKVGLYEIEWMDRTTAKVPRDWFYSMEEDGFGTCLLGKFQSQYEDVVNDKDEPDAPKKPRGISPEPRDPPPSTEEFCELSVHKQFVYTKLVLQAILRDEYAPARARHDGFIAGGKRRDQVVQNASLRGLMDPRELVEFQNCVIEWCLRDAAKVVRRTEETEQPGDAGVGEIAPEVHDEAVARAVGGGEKPNGPEARTLDSDVLESTVDTEIVLTPAITKILDEPMQDIEGSDDPATQETVCNPPSPSATVQDEAPSSPPLPPPSSSFSINSDVPMEVEEVDDAQVEVLSRDGSVPAPDVNDTIGDAFDTVSVLSDASDVSLLISSQQPPRQFGCAAYEALSTLEKQDYCLNVLLPELLIQIQVWRKGQRTSVTLLPEAEEAALHELGSHQMRLTDWVFDVQRMRKLKEEQLQKERSKDTVVGGTVSRPKKALRR
ncbi:hypothetical protein B0H19DRAFT_1040567 [Mycena capillaripes]|nr:hypothetical protein B0H19DRAFT_1040567 [Mycena capillaripes]